MEKARIARAGWLVSDRKDFRITVTVRNNNILRAAESLGMSLPQLADHVGIRYEVLSALAAMRLSPLDGRTGAVRWQVERLCEKVGKTFDELFSEHQREALDTNRSTAQISAEQAYALTSSMRAPEEPEDVVYLEQRRAVIDLALGRLTARERGVITRRNGLGEQPAMTLSEIGLEYDLSPERVRQIEAKALRKLRHRDSEARHLRHDD